MKKILIVSIASGVISLISLIISICGICIASSNRKTAEVQVTSITYTKKETEVDEYPPDESSTTAPSENDEPELFTDEEGNTYKVEFRTVDSHDKPVVIIRNTETGALYIVLGSYFEQHYQPVDG